ncbi:MAG: RluA family pseudouridine synthase [Bacteroidales bacterium]|nr:RluA family pseudouridine synthase [Bacteroidales bacterium]
MTIIYEDNHLIVVNKSPSEIVQGDKTGDAPLSDAVKLYIKNRYNKPGAVFLGVVHRLDRPVSGLVIFAKTSKALTRMNEMLRNNEIKKYYWAITCQQPYPEENTLTNHLEKNEKLNKSFVVAEQSKRAKKATLAYRLLAASDNYFLVEVELFTGRHHQIRVQLAHIGCPVKGDLKYGAPTSNKDASISLHARKVSFVHPVSKELLTLEAPPPNDPLWNFFKNNI